VLGKDGATSVGGSPCNGKDTGRLSGEGLWEEKLADAVTKLL
jgi:hypothetical protein